MQIVLRMSPALRKRIKKKAKAEKIPISEWVSSGIKELLKIKKFEGLVNMDCVAQMLSEHSEQQLLHIDEKLFRKVERIAERKKLTRSDFIHLSILHADRKFLSQHDGI